MRHSTLGRAGHEAIDDMEYVERRFNKLPWKSIIVILAIFLLITTFGTVLVAMSVDSGKVSMEVKAAMRIPDVSEVKQVIVPVTTATTQTTSTSSTTTSSSTTTTTLRIHYGVYHDATSGGWFDDVTGVGSVPSGNDPGSCGRGGLGR